MIDIGPGVFFLSVHIVTSLALITAYYWGIKNVDQIMKPTYFPLNAKEFQLLMAGNKEQAKNKFVARVTNSDLGRDEAASFFDTFTKFFVR